MSRFDSGGLITSQRRTLPVARRFAGRGTAFPLLWRPRRPAFAALKIEDFKNFLRLHVARDGSPTIYPVKIEHVPRRWRDRVTGDATPSRVVPDEPLQATLIEPPIVIPPRL